jgi:hypothetical protein
MNQMFLAMEFDGLCELLLCHNTLNSIATARSYLYVDNQVVSELRPAYGASSEPIMIGHNADEPDRNWQGEIDDVVLWDRPLSSLEVARLYNVELIREECLFPKRVPPPPPPTPAYVSIVVVSSHVNE